MTQTYDSSDFDLRGLTDEHAYELSRETRR
jgi:hypothetical protein